MAMGGGNLLGNPVPDGLSFDGAQPSAARATALYPR
jgi:hypothetical protein